MAWPFEGTFKGDAQAWLQCVGLVVIAYQLDRSHTVKQAFAKTWLFAFAWLLGCIWWLFISMHQYGGLHPVLAGLAVTLMASGLAIFYAIAGGVYHVALRQGIGIGVLPRASLFAAVWGLAEMSRGTLWTGFPWGAVGYAHVDGLLRHWAAWGGVYGVSAIAALIAMAIAAKRKEWRPTSRTTPFAIAAIFAMLGYTWLTSPSQREQLGALSAEPIRVTLLQGNIPQDLKFGEGVHRALREYRDALLASQSDLTVTPETAIPIVPEQMPDRYWAQLENHFGKGAQAALIGVPLATRTERGQLRYSNSAVALLPHSSDGMTTRYQYDKQHLVPFGEFVPPLFHWFVQMMNIPLGDFARGDVVQPSLLFKGERVAPNICYEDLFGEELARRFAEPDRAPTLMVNLSNIAWFGDTVAIDQHLNISRMRALELGRPMLRATNTGATAIINAQGQVTHRLPSAVHGALTAKVYGVHGPLTPYAQWVSVWGLWPLVALALLTLWIVAAMAYASRHGQRRFAP